MKWIRNWFSNMRPCNEPFICKDIAWNTVENFFQAMKTDSEKERRHIASLNPYEAKQYIKTIPWRKDWTKEMALAVMEHGLRQKFAHGTSWHKRLMATQGDIVEVNNWNDTYWGVCNGKGENHLGKLLMKIREEGYD